MQTTQHTRKVEVKNWRCNGSINPLLKSAGHLRQVTGCLTGSASQEYREAVRWMLIAMNGDHYKAKEMREAELDETVNAWFAQQALPIWRRPKGAYNGPWPEIFRHKGRPIYTAAQALAVMHNLHCRAQCVDLADLLCCFDLVGSYNNWSAEDGKKAFSHFDLRRYYNENNPNNGGHLFEYHFGWEASHVVYIDCSFYEGCKILDRSKDFESDFTPQDFAIVAQAIARSTHADECDLARDDKDYQTWRLWWD